MAIWVHRESVNIRRAASIGRQIIYPDARPLEPLPEQRPPTPHPVSSSSTYRCLRESQVSWLGVGYVLVTM